MNIIETLCSTIVTLFMLCGFLLLWIGIYGMIVIEKRPEIIDRIWKLFFSIEDDDFE